MKKCLAVILALVLAMLSGAVAETVDAQNEALACPAFASYVIAVGDVVKMNLDDAQLEGAELIWSSSDESVATVDADGTVTAVSAGETEISAVSGDVQISFSVQVAEAEDFADAQAAAEAQANSNAYHMALGTSMTLDLPEMEGETVKLDFSSADAQIAAVDENGVVTALNAGETQITAAVDVKIVETVEKVVTETVEETDATTGETTSHDVEKTVSEEVEKIETNEIHFNVQVDAAHCPGCDAEYTNAEEYQAHVQPAVCGAEGHYVCDGRDHETVLDEFCANENPHRICQAGEATHVCDSCGQTYACEDSGSHTTCRACGNAWCYKDNGNHVTPACGKIEHRPCVSENYHKSEHYRCKYCNQRLCNGKKHGLGKCVAAEETPAE